MWQIFVLDLHTGQFSKLSNRQEALKDRLDPETNFWNRAGRKPLVLFNTAFRLTRPESAEAIAAIYRRDAETCRRLGAKPFAYGRRDCPSRGDMVESSPCKSP